MFEHFNADSIVKRYLESNCKHLLVSPEGNTDIPQSYFDLSNWTTESKRQLTCSYTRDITNDLIGSSGVYTMQSITSGKFCIGSNTDFHSRLANHYSDYTNPGLSNRPLYSEVNSVGGFQEFL